MNSETEFHQAYAMLRAHLDALEHHALKYCLESKDLFMNMDRMKEVQHHLMPALQLVGGEGPCVYPPYYECGGFCVTYQCRELTGDHSDHGSPEQELGIG